MPSVQPVVYNRERLALWESELSEIQDKIPKSLRLIEEQKQYLRPLQDRLRSLDASISSTRLQLTSANISANQDMMHHMYHNNYGHHHRQHHHHHGVLHVVGDVVRAANIARLESDLALLHQQRRVILFDMQPYETRINQEESFLRSSYSRQEWLTKHISAANLFLHNLQNQPQESVAALANKLINAFTDYENRHLVGLSAQVRISLIAVRYGLSQLLVSPSSYTFDSMNAQHRVNYLRLSGFLWDMYTRVRHEQRDAQFEKILGGLVEDTHVLENSDLSEPMRTNSSANAWFQPFKNQYPAIFSIAEDDLVRIEADIFNQGIASLTQSSLYQYTTLQRRIVDAAKLIDAEVKINNQKHENIDYHFYGRTVRILIDVFNNPSNKQAAKHLADIAEHASGHFSVGKQVLGGLVVVLGAVLIAASVAGFVASFGSSSLLSAWGVALGMSLAQTGIACVVSSSVFAATGLGLTFFAGPNIIKSGKRQGLSQELIEISEEVDHHDRPLPSAPPMYA